MIEQSIESPPDEDGEDDDEYWMPEVVEMPIDGELDLHTFHPKEIKELVPDYLDECRARGIHEIRIVHGKGKGTLRRTVHAVLDRLDYIAGYSLAGPRSGGWGATQVDLVPLTEEERAARGE